MLFKAIYNYASETRASKHSILNMALEASAKESPKKADSGGAGGGGQKKRWESRTIIGERCSFPLSQQETAHYARILFYKTLLVGCFLKKYLWICISKQQKTFLT